jgi:hypothetical protein
VNGREAPEERYNDVDLPAEIRNNITKMIEDHYRSVKGRELIPFHVDVIIHMREFGDSQEPIRVVHTFASKFGRDKHLACFEAAKGALDVRIRLTQRDIDHAATSS